MGKKIWGKIAAALCVTVIAAGLCETSAYAAGNLLDTGDELVVVIDPGHGGENEGTQGGDVKEKEMTLVTAKAMYRALSEYDDVTVYLTRSSDEELSLAERAAFAESVDADFLFSIHYNASENHTMFGSEVWISCQAPYNAYGYQFAYNHLQNIQEELDGLLIRGVKSRVNDEGEDYYGIIRESAYLGIPALIIEHCYVDEERDASYVDSEEDWELFGEIDALSVAQYFGLKSTSLGVDYSEYPETELPQVNADEIVPGTIQDTTEPDTCTAELLNVDYQTGQIELQVSASDQDSFLAFYSVSLDGGKTWSGWESWPEADALTGTCAESFTLTLTADPGTTPRIIARAYNKADLYTDSAVIALEQMPEQFIDPSESVESSAVEAVMAEPTGSDTAGDAGGLSLTPFTIFLIAAILVMVLILSVQLIAYRRRRARRQRRIRELEQS